MDFFLVALTTFQFILRTIGVQNSALYIAVNPYTLLMPFIVIWLGAMIVAGRPVDRNLFLGWIVMLIFPCVMLRDYWGTADFISIFLRGLQYFWGPLLMIPALLGFFRLVGFVEATSDTARSYIHVLATLAGTLTLFELVAVDVLRISPLTFPWIGGSDPLHEINIYPFRPWGLPSHSQANAVILCWLFWLSYLHGVRGFYHKAVTFSGALLSFAGTGQIGLLGLGPLALKRPFLGAFIMLSPLLALIVVATLTHQFEIGTSFLSRFDFAYLQRLGTLFFAVSARFIGQLDLNELLFGTNLPDMLTVTGATHDWAYLDVFLAYGLFGLAGYLTLYATIIYLSCPIDVGVSKRVFFVIAVLLLNFHYGAINFYVGQILFSSLAALRLNVIFSQQSIDQRFERVQEGLA